MVLSTGDRVGSYEIVSALGQGGMGEVYRATDTKLKRHVAIKILPPLFASDPDRLARLQREAEVLAALNHPNIATIYGLEEADGVKALVMELVEGEDLSQRLSRGPVPLDEVLPLARQIAEALEAAHEAGIVHRDLKPANIKRRPDGTVKLLDFGLARPSSEEAVPSASGLRHRANSPTITSPASLTAAGMILGTAAYMAPEQVRGYVADRRADIWAFGVVLYELITGRRLFDEETISDTLASVLKTAPDWRALPPTLPPQLRELLRWCLEKDPKRRLQAIGDARVLIDRLLAGEVEAGAATPAIVTPRWLRLLPWALAGTLAAATLVLLFWRLDEAATSMPVRANVLLGPGLSVATTSGLPALALSRDGTQLAFMGEKDATGPSRIYVRRMGDLDATPLPGTEGAFYPFFSPDGRWIGFTGDGKLKKIAVTGGTAIDVAVAQTSRGGWWGDDGSIVFVPLRDDTISRVSAAGGTPARVGSLVDGEATQRWPQILPNGAVMFTSSRVPNAAYDEASLVVQPLTAGQRKTVLTGGFHGRYTPTGHLVYLHNGTLFARAFDLNRFEATGPALPVIEDVIADTNTGAAQFAISDTGTLVYMSGRSVAEGVTMQWLDRDGKASPLRTVRANWWNLRFAPDRRRLALQITAQSDDIWIYEWSRDVLTRLTTNAGANTNPVWTPGGRGVVFASTRESASPNLYWQRADESSGAVRLTTSGNAQRPGSFDPTGRFLVFEEFNPQTKLDLMALPMVGDDASGWKAGDAMVILNSTSNELHPVVSPDGRWLAYVSDESGRDEVYVRPFRRGGGRKRVSVSGGRAPVWSPTSAEILYGVIAAPNEGEIMIAPYGVQGDELIVGNARPWTGLRFQGRGPNRMFDVHPDGTRVALAPVIQRADQPRYEHVTVVFNFFDELRRVMQQ